MNIAIVNFGKLKHELKSIAYYETKQADSDRNRGSDRRVRRKKREQEKME